MEKPHYDIASGSNLSDVALDSVGYKNIDQRSADPNNAHKMGHENPFEQLLAEYYIEKRRDINHSNMLLEDLNEMYKNADFGMFEQKEFKKNFETAATIRKIF